ncbi:hypothetical protein BGW41_004932 [Actinomortierella wolfii]|nr:hypothetical protein BGW41_004932 [Actinomortierella wolfii]
MRIATLCFVACIATCAIAQGSHKQFRPDKRQEPAILPASQSVVNANQEPAKPQGTGKRKGHRWPTRYEVEQRVNMFKAFRADESAKDDVVLTADNLMKLLRKPKAVKKEHKKDKKHHHNGQRRHRKARKDGKEIKNN